MVWGCPGGQACEQGAQREAEDGWLELLEGSGGIGEVKGRG